MRRLSARGGTERSPQAAVPGLAIPAIEIDRVCSDLEYRKVSGEVGLGRHRRDTPAFCLAVCGQP